jgi:hypothetical protein
VKPLQRKTGSLSDRIAEIYRETFAILVEYPTIGFLFLAITLLDIAALISLFLAHSAPFSIVLAPIIRAFWDDRFLHYPQNLVLLPKLFNHAHFVILSVFGILVSGITIKKIEGAAKGERTATFTALAPVFKKYFALLVSWLVCYGVFVFMAEKILEALPGTLPVQLVVGFVVSLAVQAVFAFVLPAVLIESRGFLKNFWAGLVFGFKNFFTTILLVAVPVFMIVIFSFFKALTPVYTRSYPEAVLWVLIAGIFVSLIVDFTVTVTTTLFYVKSRN